MIHRFSDKLRSTWRFLTVSDAGLSQEEVAFIRDWTTEKQWLLARNSNKVLSFALPISTLAIYQLSPEPQRFAQIPTHLIMSMIVIYFSKYATELKHLTRQFTLALSSVATLGYASAVALTFRGGATVNDATFLTAISTAISLFTILHYPMANGSALLFVLSQNCLGLWAIAQEPTIEIGKISIYLIVLSMLAMWFFYAAAHRLKRQALTEFTVRRLLIERERAKSADVEQDIKVAQTLQTGLVTGYETSAVTGLNIQVLHHRAETLASTWCATRHLANGATVVFVADATRQGVQAGLMIHSLQALWVLGLTATSFDAANWLSTANRALAMITHPRPHDVIMSLVLLHDDRLKYFAPHGTPIWIVEQTPDQLEAHEITPQTTHMAAGNAQSIGSVEWNFERPAQRSIFMGTRGESSAGFLRSADSVLELTKELREKHTAIFTSAPPPGRDETSDRMLVWMDYAA